MAYEDLEAIPRGRDTLNVYGPADKALTVRESALMGTTAPTPSQTGIPVLPTSLRDYASSTGPLIIDWSNPITQGLVGLMDARQGYGVDLITGYKYSVTGPATTTQIAGYGNLTGAAAGPGVSSPRIGADPMTNWHSFTTNILSLAVVFVPTGNASGGIGGVGYGAGKGYYIYTQYGDGTLSAAIANGSSTRTCFGNTGDLKLGQINTAVLSNSASSANYYVNGKFKTSDSTAQSGMTYEGTFTRTSMMSGSGDVGGAQGVGIWMGLWNRPLSAAEAKAINENPYIIFKPNIHKFIVGKNTLPKTKVPVKNPVQTKQPQGQTSIDWSNPLSSGLILAYVPGINEEVVTGKIPFATYNTNGYYEQGVTTNPFYLDLTPEPANSSDPNAVRYDINVLTAAVFAKQSSPTNNDNIFCRGNGSSSATWAVGLHGGSFNGPFASIGTYSLGGINGGPSTTDKYHLVAVSGDGSTAKTYYDGRMLDSGSYTPVTTQYGGGHRNVLIGRGGMLTTPNTSGSLFLLWNRPLSDQEHAKLAENPWQLFKSTTKRLENRFPTRYQPLLLPRNTSTWKNGYLAAKGYFDFSETISPENKGTQFSTTRWTHTGTLPSIKCTQIGPVISNSATSGCYSTYGSARLFDSLSPANSPFTIVVDFSGGSYVSNGFSVNIIFNLGTPDSGTGIYLSLTSGGLLQACTSNTTIVGPAIAPGMPYRAVIGRNASGACFLWLNGKLVASGTGATAAISAASVSLQVGGDGTGFRPFQGGIRTLVLSSTDPTGFGAALSDLSTDLKYVFGIRNTRARLK